MSAIEIIETIKVLPRVDQAQVKAFAHVPPDADDLAKRAVPFFIKLGPKDNGKPLTVPGG